MLLYSNTLQIRDTLTPDEFIALAIEWNQSASKSENKIKDIHWNGAHSVRFGTDQVWMGIEEYHGGEKIAIRYEKHDRDGTVWRSDFVMDFAAWELTCQLDKELPPGSSSKVGRYSPPFFPRLLMERDYVQADGPLPVGFEPILLRRENLPLLAARIHGQARYRLAVVYVSRTAQNEVPLQAAELAYQLKGAAHVFVEEDIRMDPIIRAACFGKNEYHGAVGVYLPDGRHYKYFHTAEESPDRKLFGSVFGSVMRYWREQPLPPLRTWDSIHQALHQVQEQEPQTPDASELPKDPVQTAPHLQAESVSASGAPAAGFSSRQEDEKPSQSSEHTQGEGSRAGQQQPVPREEVQAAVQHPEATVRRSLRERIRNLMPKWFFGGAPES